MEAGAKRRRAYLIEEIKRHQQIMEVLELTDRVPSLAHVDSATHKLKIAEKLRLSSKELHGLNVQLIREGLSARTS
jgi:hypothetical protein